MTRETFETISAIREHELLDVLYGRQEEQGDLEATNV